MEKEIKDALIGMMDGIKSADGRVIAERMAYLDGVVRERGTNLHPQLLHFLQNRSYNKALLWLGGATDIPAGVCGGKAGR